MRLNKVSCVYLPMQRPLPPAVAGAYRGVPDVDAERAGLGLVAITPSFADTGRVNTASSIDGCSRDFDFTVFHVAVESERSRVRA